MTDAHDRDAGSDREPHDEAQRRPASSDRKAGAASGKPPEPTAGGLDRPTAEGPKTDSSGPDAAPGATRDADSDQSSRF